MVGQVALQRDNPMLANERLRHSSIQILSKKRSAVQILGAESCTTTHYADTTESELLGYGCFLQQLCSVCAQGYAHHQYSLRHQE